MRCYIVTAIEPVREEIKARRIASATATSKTTRADLMAQFGLRKKDVTIEVHEVPLAKPALIEYLNSVYAGFDLETEDNDAKDNAKDDSDDSDDALV